MATVRNPFGRVLIITGVVVVSIAVFAMTILVAPNATTAQAIGSARPEPDPPLASSSSSLSPFQPDPPVATPEPTTDYASSGQRTGDSGLEVIPFRPDTVRRIGDSRPSIAAEKPAAPVDTEHLSRPEGEQIGPQEPYQAPDVAALLAPMDEVLLLDEDFESGFPSTGWEVFDNNGTEFGELYWDVDDYRPYSGTLSAWPAKGGVNGVDPPLSYTNYMDSWMVYGPLDLSNMDDLVVAFGLWYETELDYDEFFLGASTDGTNFNGIVWSGTSGGWTDQLLWFTSYAGYSQVWLAWQFDSDGSIVDAGPFVDAIQVWGIEGGAPPPTPTPDPTGEQVENGGFETGDLTGWQSYSNPLSPIANGDFEYGPGVGWVEYSALGWDLIFDSSILPVTPHSESWAAWLGGGDDELAAIIQDVTIPSGGSILSYWYWIGSEDLCGYDFGLVVIDNSTVEDAFYLCEDENTDGWVRRTVDLSAYEGQTVQLDIRAETDSSGISHLFIDDVTMGSSLLALDRLQTAPRSASRPETGSLAEPKSDSQLSRNPAGPVKVLSLLGPRSSEPKPTTGELPSPVVPERLGGVALDLSMPFSVAPESAEQQGIYPTGLTGIEERLGILEVGVSSQESVDGMYAAYLWRPHGRRLGLDYLHQTIDVPAGVTDLVLNFWFGIATDEVVVGNDWFCVGLADPLEPYTILKDLGCIDAIDTAPYWQEFLYTFDSTELAEIAGQSVDLTFYLFSDLDFFGVGTGSGSTTAWVDYVRFYATGGDGAASIDPNESNDDASSATPLTCGSTITGVVGDVLGGYDVDWFELSDVPTGAIDIDIDADTKVPPSALDSVVDLWDSGVTWLEGNDDDGASYDSYVVYTNTVDHATFFISVGSYWGDGSADSFYDLTVQCGGQGSGPPPSGTGQTPVYTDTWTVMLFLNAEDDSFKDTLTKYRTDIEAFIGSKSSFLTVAILYDGPGNGDTTRYLVQPNGAYTTGTNRWDMGELNMGDPDTLAEFVNWAMDLYPADRTYLAIDDHGDGAYGISWDDTSNNDLLTPPELYAALKDATWNGTRKIDIFDYEACLMGLAENAYDLKDWVNYVVFFEQISWGIDTYPVYFGDLAATDTSLEVGRRIVDRYYAQATAEGYPHTISLIDTSEMVGVRNAVTDFGDTIRATDTQAQKDAINNARDNSQAFAADIDATNSIRAEYIDLWDLADQASGLAPTQAAAVKSAVVAAVAHERHASGGVDGFTWDHSGVHGLSIYYPTTKSSSAYDNYVGSSFYQMSRDGTWDEFLTWAVSAGVGRGMSSHRAEIRLTGGDTFVFRYVYLPAVLR